eukprot:3689252-Rhodomonas_salina.2
MTLQGAKTTTKKHELLRRISDSVLKLNTQLRSESASNLDLPHSAHDRRGETVLGQQGRGGDEEEEVELLLGACDCEMRSSDLCATLCQLRLSDSTFHA